MGGTTSYIIPTGINQNPWAPFSASDRHDLPGLIDEPVPGFATQRDDIVVGLEYPVGKPVIAHELPYVFDGFSSGALGGKNINVMLDGISSLPVVCHPARSMMSTA